MKIQKLGHWKHADAGWFRDLDNACFSGPSFDNDDRYHWWIIGDPDRGLVYGYAALRIAATKGKDDKPHRVEFSRCGVLPKFRGQGLQTKLIAARLRWCRRNGVKIVQTYTSLDNKPSQRSLTSAGFKKRRKGEWMQFRMEIE